MSRTFEAFLEYERRQSQGEIRGDVDDTPEPSTSPLASSEVCDAEVDRMLEGEIAMASPDLIAGSSRIFTVDGGPRGPLLVIGGRASAGAVRKARRALRARRRREDSPVVELHGREFQRLASLNDGPDVESVLTLIFDIKRTFHGFGPIVAEVHDRRAAAEAVERSQGLTAR